ncbi:helix-turn-helix transcriptional regulator [Flexivirga sp. B27]
MEREDLTRPDPSDGPSLGDSRAEVLGTLQSAGTPMSVTDVAAKVRLHPNTARFHLDGLVEQGLAERATEQRDVPGRPRSLYSATADSPQSGRRSYRLLAEILASYLADQEPEPTEAARRAGEAWGHFLTDRPAPFQRADSDGAIKQLVELLDEIGFAPELDNKPTNESPNKALNKRILLHQCPFREVAEEHGDVVCAVHLGLMRGVLSELQAPVDAEGLDPFVEPNLCVTRLTDANRPSSDH